MRRLFLTGMSNVQSVTTAGPICSDAGGRVGAAPHADYTSPREALPRLEKVAGKQAMLDELHKAWAYGRAQVVAADPAKLTGNYAPWNIGLARAALGMAGDPHEHLGQLIAYARVNGVKPPWSK